MFDRFRFNKKRDYQDQNEDDVSDDSNTIVSSHINVEHEINVELEPPKKKANTNGDKHQVNELVPKWQERLHAICSSCFMQRENCTHFPEKRLRLLIVGHNPSDHAWESGFSYSNPTNRMWNLLTGSFSSFSWNGIIPAGAHVTEQNRVPLTIGVGFTSIGLEPGNDASKYGKKIMYKWKLDFYKRLRKHAANVCRSEHATYRKDQESIEDCKLPHFPMLIAFSGKRQFSWLFTPVLSKIEAYGKQTTLPSDWPINKNESEVWVLPSSSGRAAMTIEERARPYEELANRMHLIPWVNTEEIGNHFS